MSDTHKIITGGQAFPCPETEWNDFDPGMSLHEYAAIQLRVPESGIDWLDAMILKAKRDDFAGQALSALVGTLSNHEILLALKTVEADAGVSIERLQARKAYWYADAMLDAREGGPS